MVGQREQMQGEWNNGVFLFTSFVFASSISTTYYSSLADLPSNGLGKAVTTAKICFNCESLMYNSHRLEYIYASELNVWEQFHNLASGKQSRY